MWKNFYKIIVFVLDNTVKHLLAEFYVIYLNINERKTNSPQYVYNPIGETIGV